MKTTPTKIAVAGATGRVGRHTVDLLRAAGHDVVEISRSNGVDIITGEGLEDALAGVECIIDAATGPSPVEEEATEFFSTATGNLQKFGEQAGVQRIIVVSIIGIDQSTSGYGAAKRVHEAAMLAGSIPVRILRASQFHEFVGQLMDWGRQGDVTYVPNMRTQLVAARTVAQALADLVTESPSAPGPADATIVEIAGPREESLVEVATQLAARRGDKTRVEGVTNFADPDHAVNENGGLLPGPTATLAGPTFAAWLDQQSEQGSGEG